MITKNIYICEYCNTEYYGNEEEALNCEKRHKKELKLIGKKYHSSISVYPETVFISFENENEKVAKYNLVSVGTKEDFCFTEIK